MTITTWIVSPVGAIAEHGRELQDEMTSIARGTVK
jgi:hypothetical protein